MYVEKGGNSVGERFDYPSRLQGFDSNLGRPFLLVVDGVTNYDETI